MTLSNKNDILNKFWSIYEIEGTIQALSWLDTLKYYEEYCENDNDIINKIKKMNI